AGRPAIHFAAVRHQPLRQLRLTRRLLRLLRRRFAAGGRGVAVGWRGGAFGLCRGVGTGGGRFAAPKARRQFLNLVLVGPDGIARTAQNQNRNQSRDQALIGTLFLAGRALDIFAATGLRLLLGAVQLPVIVALGHESRCILIVAGAFAALALRRVGKCRLVVILGRRGVFRCTIRLLQKIVQRILDRRLRRGGWRRIKGFDFGNGVFKDIALADSHSLR